MCSAMEEIKEKVFDVEEEHNLCEKLSNWRKIMKFTLIPAEDNAYISIG